MLWPVVMLLLFGFSFPAFSHEAVMPDGSKIDYTGKRNPWTYRDCCGGVHCRPVRWQEAKGGVVLYEITPNNFRPAPKMTELPPLDSNAHVCMMNPQDIICVFQPGMGM